MPSLFLMYVFICLEHFFLSFHAGSSTIVALSNCATQFCVTQFCVTTKKCQKLGLLRFFQMQKLCHVQMMDPLLSVIHLHYKAVMKLLSQSERVDILLLEGGTIISQQQSISNVSD